MKTDAATFRRLLSALEWLAHFPKANLLSVCERRKCNADEVLAAITDMVGGLKHWDPDMLAEFAGKLGVEVPPFQPTAFPVQRTPAVKPPVVVVSAPAGAVPPGEGTRDKILKIAREKPSSPKPSAPPAAPARKGKRRTAAEMKAVLASVVRELLKADGRTAAEICIALDVAPSRWIAYKAKHLGKGKPTAEALQIALAELEGKSGVRVETTPATPPAAGEPAAPPRHVFFTGGSRGGKTEAMRAFFDERPEWPKIPALVPMPRDPVQDQLDELALLTEAYRDARDRGLPVAILRAALIDACQSVANAGFAAVVGGGS